MGDRANIGLQGEHAGEIQVYTHWNGSEAAQTLAGALERGQDRWGDESYLNRIIVTDFIKQAGLDDLTGCGIAGRDLMGPNALVLDHDAQTVSIREGVGDAEHLGGHVGKTLSFPDFIALVAAEPDPWGEE